MPSPATTHPAHFARTSPLLTRIARVPRDLRDHLRRRRTLALLRELDDHLLADIGLRRDQLHGQDRLPGGT